MPLMTISFALPFHLLKDLGVAKIGKLIKNTFQKVLRFYYDYHKYLGNSLQFLLFLVQILSPEIVLFSAKTDLLFCIDFVFGKALNKCFL